MSGHTQTIKTVFEHFGENATTPYTPTCEYRNFTGDIEEKVSRFAFWDDDQKFTSIPRYKVLDIEIPIWMTFDEWAKEEYISLRSLIRDGLPKDTPKHYYRKIKKLKGFGKYSAVKLLSPRLRSDFRKSLKEQLIKWLDGENDYDSPFSDKQWGCFKGQADFKRLDNNIYWDKVEYRGWLR